MPGLAPSFVLAVVCATLGGCGAAQPTVTTPLMPDAFVAEVRGTIEQWRQGYEVRSVEALAKLYAQDPDVVLVQQGVVLRGWAAIESALKDRLTRATAIRVRLKDLTVVPIGTHGASVLATMAREVSDGVTTVTEEGILTLALRHGDASWSIVSEHYSYAVR
jgi:ketosteroid isomerase-like protein